MSRSGSRIPVLFGMSVGASTAIIAGLGEGAIAASQSKTSGKDALRSSDRNTSDSPSSARQHNPLGPDIQPKSTPMNFTKDLPALHRNTLHYNTRSAL